VEIDTPAAGSMARLAWVIVARRSELIYRTTKAKRGERVYGWRKIPLALKCPEKGEEKAQSGENA
jgi:hypothetical protein